MLEQLRAPARPASPVRKRKVVLSRLPLVRPLVYSRWPLFLARAITLAGFLLTILAGLFGSVVGSHNFAVIFVWIAWWTLLKLVFIPFGGRSWCAVCPIPMPGEWLSQRAIFPTPGSGRRFGSGLAWPRRLKLPLIGAFRLRGAWLQAFGFLAIGMFSAVTLTSPRVTGWALLGILALATALALVFSRPADSRRMGQPGRPFCASLCPIGGFSGLYAQVAPLEVRVDDTRVCTAHAEKTCYSACPWDVYVAAQQENGPCGLCLECLRVCPNDNVALNLRAFGADWIESRRLPRPDETYLALVMLGCGLAFSALFLGPWGALRRAAYAVGSLPWLAYAGGFLAFAGLLAPGLFALAVRLGGRVADWRKELARCSRPLLPLGLAAWVAFTVSFAFAKSGNVLAVLSDPLGFGWDLFGAARVQLNPDVSLLAPLLQVAVLLGGLLWSAAIARRDCGSRRRSLAVQAFNLLIVVGMLVLLV